MKEDKSGESNDDENTHKMDTSKKEKTKRKAKEYKKDKTAILLKKVIERCEAIKERRDMNPDVDSKVSSIVNLPQTRYLLPGAKGCHDVLNQSTSPKPTTSTYKEFDESTNVAGASSNFTTYSSETEFRRSNSPQGSLNEPSKPLLKQSAILRRSARQHAAPYMKKAKEASAGPSVGVKIPNISSEPKPDGKDDKDIID